MLGELIPLFHGFDSQTKYDPRQGLIGVGKILTRKMENITQNRPLKYHRN
jgi:hypothetical protein